MVCRKAAHKPVCRTHEDFLWPTRQDRQGDDLGAARRHVVEKRLPHTQPYQLSPALLSRQDTQTGVRCRSECPEPLITSEVLCTYSNCAYTTYTAWATMMHRQSPHPRFWGCGVFPHVDFKNRYCSRLSIYSHEINGHTAWRVTISPKSWWKNMKDDLPETNVCSSERIHRKKY